MKKILLSAAMMVAAVSFANAQWFVGGAVGFNKADNGFLNLGDIDGDGIEEVVDGEYMDFTILPKVGYIFNENWAVGLSVGYQSAEIKDVVTVDAFTVAPFVRFTPWYVGKFSLAFQGQVEGEFGGYKPNGGSRVSYTNIGFEIAPVVQFDLTCNVMLESKFNFASLNFNYFKPKDGDSNVNYGFGVDTRGRDITGDIELGFIVKF